MNTPSEIAQRLEVDIVTPLWDRWDVVDVTAEGDHVTVCAENDYGDKVSFKVTVSEVVFEAGGPDEIDREEPEDDPI